MHDSPRCIIIVDESGAVVACRRRLAGALPLSRDSCVLMARYHARMCLAFQFNSLHSSAHVISLHSSILLHTPPFCLLQFFSRDSRASAQQLFFTSFFCSAFAMIKLTSSTAAAASRSQEVEMNSSRGISRVYEQKSNKIRKIRK